MVGHSHWVRLACGYGLNDGVEKLPTAHCPLPTFSSCSEQLNTSTVPGRSMRKEALNDPAEYPCGGTCPGRE